MTTDYRIAVLPGDGIGPEVIAPTLTLLEAAMRRAGAPGLAFEEVPAGAGLYRETGHDFPDDSMRRSAAADAILLGAMGLPDVRRPDGTELAPQLDLRERLGLYAGVRPIRAFAGLPQPLADPRAGDIDFVIIRESTEGLFASRGKGVIEEDRVARDTMVITRATSERLFDFAAALAKKRQARGRSGLLTLVDKSNVFTSFAFFRRIFDERVQNIGVKAERAYIDATALDLVRRPWDFDVLVTENMFGDILSDLGAALVGGMGMAPSADVGDTHAVFQPSHGSAPDIAGRGLANPTAAFLSAAMMLEWLGERHNDAAAGRAAGLIERAVAGTFAEGAAIPPEFGGKAGTKAVAEAVMARLEGLDPDAAPSPATVA